MTIDIIIQREDLLKPLGYAAGVVERKQTMPILSNVLLAAEQDGLQLTGTDLEVEVVASAKHEGEKSGKITLPARKLFDICRALPENASLVFKKEGDRITIKSGRSRFSLSTLPAVDFPSVDVAAWQNSFSISQRELKSLLERTQFCMAQQDVRYYLNGLMLEVEKDRLCAVATDGHRLAISQAKLTAEVEGHQQVIVPRKGVHEMIRFLQDSDDDAKVQLSSNHIRVVVDGILFTAKLIDGRFPDYTKVIPSMQTKNISLDRSEFREALSRVSILTNEKYRGVRFKAIQGILEITAHNPEQEEAQEELAIDYDGEEIEIGFNVNYIIDAANTMTADKVIFGMTDPNSSCTLSEPDNENTKYVIMPMRL